MFQMTVDDVLVVRGNVAISGKCENINELTPKLVDDAGTEYATRIPFIKYVIPPVQDNITLEIKGVANPASLKGRILMGLS